MTEILIQLLEDLQINEEELIKELLHKVPRDINKRVIYDGCVHNWTIVLGLQGQKNKAVQTLLKTRGDGFKEIVRNMRLQKFTNALYLIQLYEDDEVDRMDSHDDESSAKSICYFLLTGQLDMEPREQEMFIPQILPEQFHIKTLNYDKYASYQIVEILESQFQEKLQQGNTHILEYISRHRRQAYIYVIYDYLLNEHLIEMNIQQMCRILLLPTDYFNEYYQIAFQTILYLHMLNKQISQSSFVDEQIQGYLRDNIKFEEQSRNRIQNKFLESQLHNGLVKAIVNKKIKLCSQTQCAIKFLQKQLSQEQISGLLDGILIYRSMKRNNDEGLISDLIYDVLIFKLP